MNGHTSTRCGCARNSDASTGIPTSAWPPTLPGYDELPHRERAQPAGAERLLAPAVLGEGTGERRLGALQSRLLACDGAAPERPGPGAEPVVELGRDVETVVGVAVVVADQLGQQVPRRTPRLPRQPERRRGSARIAEREVEPDQDPPARVRRMRSSMKAAASRRVARLTGLGVRSRPANAHQIESRTPFRRTGGAPIDDDVDVELGQRAQLTTVAMTAKWSIAATTVKLCHTSW